MRDMVQKGRRAYTHGEAHPRARFTGEQVGEIREEISQGSSCASLAARFGVSKSTIEAIKYGRNW